MTLTVSEARARLSELVNRAAYGKEHILIGARGKPKAVLISFEELELLEEALEEHEDALAAQESEEEYRRGEMITLDELKAELRAGAHEDDEG
jgi:antitoxin YefM